MVTADLKPGALPGGTIHPTARYMHGRPVENAWGRTVTGGMVFAEARRRPLPHLLLHTEVQYVLG